MPEHQPQAQNRKQWIPMYHPNKPQLRLGMSALMGDLDLYLWVFGCQILHLDLWRSFPMNHLEPWVKNPWVNGYPQVLPMMDSYEYSWVYQWVPTSRSIKFIQVLLQTTLINHYAVVRLWLCCFHHFYLLLWASGLIHKQINNSCFQDHPFQLRPRSQNSSSTGRIIWQWVPKLGDSQASIRESMFYIRGGH